MSLERGEKPRASATWARLRASCAALRFSRNPRLFADYSAASTRGSVEKKRRREREISGHFSTPLCKSRNAADYARFWRERARKPGGGGGKKRGKRKKKEESGKGNKKGGLPGLWPLAGPRTRSTGSVRGGREGKLNVRKKVANVVKIRDRQSGALCPAGEQYRRRSGDWRIFLRIGRHCWIFQIVFLAYAAAEIARNPFGHCHLSILLLSILRFIAIYQIYRS